MDFQGEPAKFNQYDSAGWQAGLKIDRLVRSRRKTITIVVAEDGTLEVRAPLAARRADIQGAVEAKTAWIEAVRARLPKILSPQQRTAAGRTVYYLGQLYPLQYVQRGPAVALADGKLQVHLGAGVGSDAAVLLEAWYRRQARAYLEERTRQLAAQCGFRYARVSIGSARTRWGSCSTSGTISYPWRLVMAPPGVVDYVILHELVHTVIPNHSRAYWERLEQLAPDFDQQRAWLKVHHGEMVL